MQSRMRLFLLIGSLLFCLTGCRHITTTDVICTTEPDDVSVRRDSPIVYTNDIVTAKRLLKI